MKRLKPMNRKIERAYGLNRIWFDLRHVFDAVCLFALAALPVLLFAVLFALPIVLLLQYPPLR